MRNVCLRSHRKVVRFSQVPPDIVLPNQPLDLRKSSFPRPADLRPTACIPIARNREHGNAKSQRDGHPRLPQCPQQRPRCQHTQSRCRERFLIPAQFLSHLRRRTVALPEVLLQRPVHDPIQLGRKVGPYLLERRGILVQDRIEDRDLAVSLEGPPAAQQLVEDHAQ